VDVLANPDEALPTAPLSGQQMLAALNSTGTLFWVSSKADRSASVLLDGANVGATSYIFLKTDLKAKVVRFWIDDIHHNGTPDQIERNAPYDAGGGPAELPKPLRLSAGKHTMTAVVELTNGQKKGFSATFTVGTVSAPVAGQALATTTTAASPTTTVRPATTTTTRPATTTTAAPSGNKPAGAIEIRPGDNVAAKVSGAANGATFYFQPGTYSGVSIQPKSGQTFIAASGVVFDGNGKQYAFKSGSPNVTIRGFEITGYSPPNKNGAVMGDGSGTGWRIENNEIHHNKEIGVKAVSGWDVVGNSIHHNGRYGVQGAGSGINILDNEISYNSTDYGMTNESGGTKFVLTTGLVIRGNHVHHNYGNGLWVDINNVKPLIEDNLVQSNHKAGIVMEISCGGTIRNNRVEGNSFEDPYDSWMSGAAILVANSPNVTVSGNRLSGNAKGIGGLHWDHPNRGAVTECSPELKNFKVTGNTISQSTGPAAGIDAKINKDQVWSSWGNTFSGNSYSLSGDARFRWEGGWVSASEWGSQGLD
jgi:parallel beta-helix repeat protein